jgi:hypothetical protein
MHETLRTLRWSEVSVPALASKVRRAASTRLRHRQGAPSRAKTPQAGLPPGCTREMIDEACREATGKPPSKTRFRHLSSWKPQGAFLVEATLSENEIITLVFKRTVATPEFNPAHDQLPLTPGPAEHVIYEAPPGRLRAFLPRVFAAWELEPGVEYAFVAEDLHTSHRPVNRSERIGLIDHLRALHEALAELDPGPHKVLLNDFLGTREELADFYGRRLGEPLRTQGDRTVSSLRRQASKVVEVYRSVELHESAAGLVHGDPNLANIHVPRQGDGPPKFVDWEWAGTHLHHIDLTSILKFADPLFERDGLRRYSEQHPSLPEDLHRRLYYWCKLDKSLIDVCQMTALAEDPAPRRMNDQVFLKRSARAALHAYAQLQRT